MRGALFSMWIYGSIGFCVGMRGRNLYSYCAGAAPAPPLSFSCVKKKEGGERKSLIQQTHGKRTRRIFLSYQLEIAIAPWGRPPLEERGCAPFFTPPCRKYILKNIRRYSSQQRLSAGKRVLFPRYERADARSILERSPKLYNQVWSPRLRTASPINQNKIIPPRLRLPFTDPRMGSAA